MGLGTSNQCALFQRSIDTLLYTKMCLLYQLLVEYLLYDLEVTGSDQDEVEV